MKESRGHSGFTGGILGAIVFIVGILLLSYTFKLASDLFTTNPASYFNTPEKTPIDANKLSGTVLGLVFRLIMLLVMAIIGGMIANRGIRMFSDSRGTVAPANKQENKEA